MMRPSAKVDAYTWPMLSRHLGFQRVIFDCDMTLVKVEGIDELARLKGQAEHIADLTGQAMDGKIPLEEVYAQRLELLRPTRAELEEVGRIYRRSLTPQAVEVVAVLQLADVEVFIVSGGLKAAVLDLAEMLKVPAQNVHAVAVRLDELSGSWWDYTRHQYAGNPDETYFAFAPTPLAESSGKLAVVRNLASAGKRTWLATALLTWRPKKWCGYLSASVAWNAARRLWKRRQSLLKVLGWQACSR